MNRAGYCQVCRKPIRRTAVSSPVPMHAVCARIAGYLEGSTTRNRTDPLLSTRQWTTVIRSHWIAQRLPCSRCGCAIDYDGPRFIPGTRKLNPSYLVVGHIVGRFAARQAGWTDEQINDLSNTQPECARCSSVSGGKELVDLQRRGLVTKSSFEFNTLKIITTPDQLDSSREW